MIEVDKETRGFKPTIEWMRKKYNEMNKELFNDSLGNCYFNIFTTGRGSGGNTLGTFQIKAKGLKYDRYSKAIYKETYTYPYRIAINYNNFFEECHPTISLNGNYSGTEYGFLSTLVHEMCHYYTYMRGYAPTRAHGSEFYHIGEAVALRSYNLFTIQRLADAEDMSHLDLSDDMKEKKNKRIANKKASMYALFDYHSDNDIRLITTSSEKLIDTICDFDINRFSKQIIITNDLNVINSLFEMGYQKNFRTWRYWNVGGEKWLSILDDADKKIFKNPNPINEVKQHKNIDMIISEAINKVLIEKVDNEMGEISPDMDLGAYSPLEME